MAEHDPTELVAIKYESTGEVREVPRGALPFFTNQGFVELDAAGRRKAQQTTTPVKES